MSDTSSELEQLIHQLGKLGEFHTAWEPAVALGDNKLQGDVAALLETYPFLTRDEGYVRFLRSYGGALLTRDRDGLLFSLFGFSHDIGLHIVDGPGEPVSDGCLIVGDMIVPRDAENQDDTVPVGLGFDATGQRRWGVYRTVSGGAAVWYCETFLDWLREVVRRDGQLAG